MGIEFFQTVMGKQFYEGTMPALVRELSRLNKNLEKLIQLQERPHEAAEEGLGQGPVEPVLSGSVQSPSR